MSLTGDIIRSRIGNDVEAGDMALVSGMIQDTLAPGAGLMEIEAAVAKARTVWSPLFRQARPLPTPSPVPTTETVTARVAREAREASARQETPGRTFSNPWSAATRNLTQQVLLEARDPARAAQLKREAGV